MPFLSLSMTLFGSDPPLLKKHTKRRLRQTKLSVSQSYLLHLTTVMIEVQIPRLYGTKYTRIQVEVFCSKRHKTIVLIRYSKSEMDSYVEDRGIPDSQIHTFSA